MWTSTNLHYFSKRDNWWPNHFVPLVSLQLYHQFTTQPLRKNKNLQQTDYLYDIESTSILSDSDLSDKVESLSKRPVNWKIKTCKRIKTGNDMFGLRETSLLCDSETESDHCSPCTALPTQPKTVNKENFCKFEEIDIETSDSSGPLPRRFFTTEELLDKLENFRGEPLQFIPNGNKCYKYFLFQNQFIHGKKNVFVDDCGAWVGGSVKHTYYVKENNGSRLRLEKKGVYCTYKRSEEIKSHPVYNPLKKQPSEQELVGLYRYNTKLKANENCKRRISFLVSKPEVALVEYIGEYVDPTLPHGNVKEVKNLPVVAPPYLRTHKHILESIKEAMKEAAETVVQNLISKYGIASVRDKKKFTM